MKRTREDDIAEVFDLLRDKYVWFDKIMAGVSRIAVDKNSNIQRLIRDRDDWRRLAEQRAHAHDKGYSEAKAYCEDRIQSLKKQVNDLQIDYARVSNRLRWFRDREGLVEQLVGAINGEGSPFEVAALARTVDDWVRDNPKPSNL